MLTGRVLLTVLCKYCDEARSGIAGVSMDHLCARVTCVCERVCALECKEAV